jgi:excisionase family DNA binding protein
MSEGLMTVKEVLDHLKIGRTKLYELVGSGNLRTVKIGKRTLFDPDDVKKFIEGQKTGTKPPEPVRKTARPKE